MRSYRIHGLLLVTLFLAGCMCGRSPHMGDMGGSDADVRAGIARGGEMWMSAFNRLDGRGVADVYTEDAILLPANAPAMHGREAILGFFDSIKAMSPRDMVLTTDEVQNCGDWAVEVGRYSFTLQPVPGGDRVNDHGKSIVIWKRQADGSWKIYRDIFNSDLPAAPMPH